MAKTLLFALLLAVCGLCPAFLRATVARDLGFGAADAFIVSDASYPTLPQVVDANKGAAYLDLGADPPVTQTSPQPGGIGNDVNAWGGADIPFGSGALGVWLGRPDNDFAALYASSQMTLGGLPAGFAAGMNRLAGLGGLTAGSTIGSLYGGDPAQGRVDLIYAFEWSDRLTFAVGLNRANSDQKLDFGAAGSDSYDANNLGLTLGCDVKRVTCFDLLQVGLQVNEESLNAAVNAGGLESSFDSTAEGLSLRVGGDTLGEGAGFGRAELGFRLADLAVQSQTGGGVDATDNGVGSSYNLGYAVGLSQDRGMGLCGLMLNGTVGGDNVTTATNGTTYNNADLVLSAAGEFKLKEWLTARGGLSGSLVSSGVFVSGPGPSAAEPTYSSSNSALADGSGLVAPSGTAQVSMGLSLDLGDLIVDGVLNQNILYSGGYLASGIPEALFGQVSATWRWE